MNKNMKTFSWSSITNQFRFLLEKPLTRQFLILCTFHIHLIDFQELKSSWIMISKLFNLFPAQSTNFDSFDTLKFLILLFFIKLLIIIRNQVA